jgi:hypothetical protein
MRLTAHSTVFLVLCCLLPGLLACAHNPTTSTEQSLTTPSTDASVVAFAENLMAKGVEAEPWITPALTYLTELQMGEMIGLEFRFKSLDSTIRKIETRMMESNIAIASDVSIRDTLRYTIQFDDQPAGHHDQAVAYVLATMEELGHTVLAVKNYWPSGDDYSGINTNLQAPNGLAWELQFHTLESFDLKMSSHEVYEQVRQSGISIETRRSLYDQVAKQWMMIPVPAGVLEPGSLHSLEQVIIRPSP